MDGWIKDGWAMHRRKERACVNERAFVALRCSIFANNTHALTQAIYPVSRAQRAVC